MTKEELIKMREDLGLEQSELADLLDLSKSYISKLETGAVPITDKIAGKLKRKIETLLRSTSNVKDPSPQYRKATAGRTVASNYKVHLRGLLSPVVDDLPEGNYELFEVEGSSMERTFSAGDHLLCMLDKIEAMIENRVYVLVLEDPRLKEYRPSGVWVKRCNYRKSNEYITCRSDNKDTTEPFPTFKVKTSMVKEVWYPVKRFTSNMSDPNRDIYDKLDEIEGRLEMVEAELNLENQ